MGLTTEKVGQAFGKVATGALLMSGAMDKVSETGQLAGQTLGAFLAGGPIAAGVVGLTGAFRLLAEHTSKAGEQAKVAEKAYQEMLGQVRSGADDAEKRLEDLALKSRIAGLRSMGIDVPADVLTKDKLAGELRMQALNEQDRVNGLGRVLDALLQSGNIPEFLKQNASTDEQRRRVTELNAERLRQADALEREIEMLEKIQTLEAGGGRPTGGQPAPMQMKIRTGTDGSQWWERTAGDWIRVNSDEQLRVLRSIDSKMGAPARTAR
jgi:hypothetical protein